MFTGLVDHVGTVLSSRPTSASGGRTLRIESKFADFVLGESIACDGVCLTVERWTGGAFEVTAGDETLRLTTIGSLKAGSALHLERALRLGDRLGGHMVQGHVDGMGEVAAIVPGASWTRVDIRVPAELAKYIAPKGSVCVDGVSLTVNEVQDAGGVHTFSVGLVPHTLTVTHLSGYAPGRRVNIETDLLARYLERLAGFQGATPLSRDLLARAGFLT